MTDILETLSDVEMPLHRVCWSFDLIDYDGRKIRNASINAWLVDNLGVIGDRIDINRHTQLGVRVSSWSVEENEYGEISICSSIQKDECWEILHSRALQLMPDAYDIFYINYAFGEGWVRTCIGAACDHPTIDNTYHMWLAFDDELVALQCKLALS
jgi:hypothetical protein